MARGMIELVERSGRDTERSRRRTRPRDDAYDGAYYASLGRGRPLPDTPAERGLDAHA
jgi:hypothetical protein